MATAPGENYVDPVSHKSEALPGLHTETLLKSPGTCPKIYPSSVQNMSETYPKHVRNMCKSYPRHVQDMSKTCSRDVQDMSKTCSRYVQDTCSHVQDMSKTCPRHVQSIAKACPRHVQDIPGTFQAQFALDKIQQARTHTGSA